MRALLAWVRLIERLCHGLGLVAAVLVPFSVLVCAFVALARYGFSFGHVWIQELYVVAFGASFMLATPWAYARDQHVRVDIVSRKLSPRARAWIEILGVLLFLLPWIGLVLWSSWGFVQLSWMVREPSPNADGLPGLFLVKSVIPLAMTVLALQGTAAIARNVLYLAGHGQLLTPISPDSNH